MSYERFGEPKWMRVLRALAANFRVGRFFGVEVRMYWLGAILVPLLIWPSYGRAGYPALEGLVMSLLTALGLFFVIYTHEMSHIAAGWRYHIRTPLITLSPLGGLAHMSAPAPNPKASMFISAAGPAVHLPWLLLLWPLSIWVPLGSTRPDGWVADPLAGMILILRDMNLYLCLFNLLPFFPMDGGRVLQGALSLKMNPNRASIIAARVGMGGAAAIAIYAIFFNSGWWSGVLLAIAITNFFECRREVMRARWGQSPFGEVREAWQSDPEAWRHGESPFDSSQTMGGQRGSTRSSRRAEKKAARARERARDDAARLDELLARVSDVGVAGLSARERATLKRLSQRSNE